MRKEGVKGTFITSETMQSPFAPGGSEATRSIMPRITKRTTARPDIDRMVKRIVAKFRPQQVILLGSQVLGGADLVNVAYEPAAEETALMGRTVPPRMPGESPATDAGLLKSREIGSRPRACRLQVSSTLPARYN